VKALFGCLVCLVFATSHVLAVPGGPRYEGDVARTSGIFAGVFVPTQEKNTLGLFSLSVPREGLGTGTVALFRNGTFYPGTIQASADPANGQLDGVVNAGYERTVAFTEDERFVYTYTGNGLLNARITSMRGRRFSTASDRIRGSAQLTYHTSDPSAPLGSTGTALYIVDGFKQTQL
jgi:hypothetical protein